MNWEERRAAEQSRWPEESVGLASQKWLLKDPITERFLAAGGRDAEESLTKALRP